MGNKSGKRLSPKHRARFRKNLEARRRNAPWRDPHHKIPAAYRDIHCAVRSHVKAILGRHVFNPNLLRLQPVEYKDGWMTLSVGVASQRRSLFLTSTFSVELANPTAMEQLEAFIIERIRETNESVWRTVAEQLRTV